MTKQVPATGPRLVVRTYRPGVPSVPQALTGVGGGPAQAGLVAKVTLARVVVRVRADKTAAVLMI
jgi:hypothetical protein